MHLSVLKKQIAEFYSTKEKIPHHAVLCRIRGDGLNEDTCFTIAHAVLQVSSTQSCTALRLIFSKLNHSRIFFPSGQRAIQNDTNCCYFWLLLMNMCLCIVICKEFALHAYSCDAMRNSCSSPCSLHQHFCLLTFLKRKISSH